MTPAPNPPPVAESVEVTQADREAAASIIVLTEYQEAVIAGRCDDAPSVLAFARHRAASHESGRIAGVREGLERAAKVARDYQTVADATFLSTKGRIERGDKDLEVTLSCALGMAHQASQIATSIRALSKGEIDGE